MSNEYDFIVIGGGSGGIASARRAAEYGARTLVIENSRMGGTCVNVGCVPKKVMWNAAQIGEAMDLAHDYGFNLNRQGFEWSRIKQARDAYVKRLNDIYKRNLEKSNVDVVQGTGQFIDNHAIQVDSNEYTAPHVLIATGGRPTVPDLPGADLGITSDGFFQLESRPQNALVIGAGYIATELAGVLHALGSRVTMAIRYEKLLRSFDHTLHDLVMEQMQNSGINFLTNTNMEGLIKDNNGTRGFKRNNGERVAGFDCIIWAIGRETNIETLRLKNTDVETNDRGFVTTDQYQNTSAEGVYAVGDVTPRAQLTPVAIAAGRRLSERLFNNKPESRLDYSNIPTVIFSHPPIGTVGLSELEARQRFDNDIRTYQSRFINMRYAVSEHKPPTLVKLIVQGQDEKVVGCHIIGDGADEMTQGFAVAIKMGATKQDFDDTVAIHPTAAEELVTLR
ncbi:MAG: glutathione-disulfide reductase [Arenicellales bacterium]